MKSRLVPRGAPAWDRESEVHRRGLTLTAETQRTQRHAKKTGKELRLAVL
jgi:hypothetical protein